ncbi:MAG: phosphoribosylanthranilate isomerase [Alphaproteobacteria bacterium]
MSVEVKICGLCDAESVAATVAGGARYAGFVFYSKSPRAVDAESAAALIARLPASTASVGLFVDAGDDEIRRVLRIVSMPMIQLHGTETPERVAAVKKLTGLPVIKAVGIAAAQDVEAARRYESVADMLLLDAKPLADGLPGGNAAIFDWGLLKNASFARPWMLAGGLNEQNIAAAVAATGARILDVSSGVEEAVGRKNSAKIKAFLEKAHRLETCC